jgi:hypothetical protein
MGLRMKAPGNVIKLANLVAQFRVLAKSDPHAAVLVALANGWSVQTTSLMTGVPVSVVRATLRDPRFWSKCGVVALYTCLGEVEYANKQAGETTDAGTNR